MPLRRRRIRADETLVAPPPVAPPPPGAPVGPPPGEYAPPPPREWWPWMLALLILVLAGLLAGWLLTRDDGKSSSGETTVVVTRATTGETATTQTTAAADTVAVARVVGQTAPQAVETLRGQGLKSAVVSVFSDQPKGTVIAQAPAAGTKASAGSEVQVNVSKGAKNVEVPNVVGLPAAQAAGQLEAAGLAANTVEVPSAEAKGTVVAQNPAAGGQAAAGSRVRLNVSSGERPAPTATAPATTTPAATTGTTTTTPKPAAQPSGPVTVPDLVGENRKTAAEKIRALKLRVTIRYVPAEDAVGTVVSQSPAAGTTRKPGEGVLINLSFGPGGQDTAKAVPSVMGKDEQTATSILQGAGFVVEVWRQTVSRSSQNGVVIDEQPGAGQQAPEGSTITITVGSTSG
jgi:beta-lactam-binding protein with PASTA domain